MDLAGTALWTFLIFAVIWLVVLITSINGLVKRDDIPLSVKIFWGVIISLAPVIGLIAYVVLGRKRIGKTG